MKRPGPQLQDDVYRQLLESAEIAELLPDDGKPIVLKPTANDDDELASAVLRVRVIDDATEPDGMVDEHTLLAQVQIDWTSDWHRDSGPTWEIDLRSAIHNELGRLGGPNRTALGAGGGSNAVWSGDLNRYLGDATYRYRVADILER